MKKFIKVDIKPLSVNQAWKGRRFKTDMYKRYEKIVSLMLPRLEIPKGKLSINYEFGFSNILSDIDNPVKNFQDILCKKYGFDDKVIYEINIKKEIVRKGNEFVKFKIDEYIR